MVHISSQRIELAAELRLDGTDQIVRLAYRPTPGGEDGPTRLVLESVYAGRLRIPYEFLFEQIRARMGKSDAQDADRVIAAVRTIELAVRLQDRRVVVVSDVSLGEGRAVLTCHTRSKEGNGRAIRTWHGTKEPPG